jgi:hypothetical protein
MAGQAYSPPIEMRVAAASDPRATQHAELTMPMNLPMGIGDHPAAATGSLLSSLISSSPAKSDLPAAPAAPAKAETKVAEPKKKVASHRHLRLPRRVNSHVLLCYPFLSPLQKTNINRSVAKSRFTVLLVEDVRVSQKLCMASLKKVIIARTATPILVPSITHL